MVIVASKYGRLANRVFTFAHLAASAREHGYEVWNPAFDEYAEFFPATAGDVLCRFPARRSRLAHPWLRHAAYMTVRKLAGASARLGGPLPVVRIHGEEELDIGAPTFVERARRGPLLVQGWLFRDHASLRRHGDEIRRFLTPRPEHLERADAVAARARDGADVLVGVHVRRGDYRTWQGGRYYWEAPTYAAVMERVADLFPGRRVAFLVSSDEPVEGLRGARGTGDPLDDLYALARCDYLLGPPSTYSAWASFYGGVPLTFIREPDDTLTLGAFSVVGAAAP